MRYFKATDSGYILFVGIGNNGTEITEEEYNEILSVISNAPEPQEGYSYRLKTDLTWEEYQVEPPEPSEDIDPAEMADALEGIL